MPKIINIFALAGFRPINKILIGIIPERKNYDCGRSKRHDS
jgi:hypothetical protein